MRAIGRLSVKAAPEGSRRRKWVLGTTALAIAAVVALFVSNALAVHDDALQLDGDVSTQAYSVPDSSKQIYDWGANTAGNTSGQANPNTNGIFNVTDTGTAPTGTEAVTNNGSLVNHGSVTTNPFAAASFVRDFRTGSGCTLDSLSTTFCTSDTSTYATGSKDTLGIGNGGWQCNKDNNVNSKIDIMNAYSASYFTGGDGTGDHLIYFGLEKNKNNGTNDVGVWLLQGTASCSKTTGGSGQNFTGQHQNKDVLVVSEFSNGGGVSTIQAFQWAAAASGPLSGDGGCIDSNDWPDPNSNAPGVTPPEKGCNGKPIFTANNDCKTAGGNDPLCATTNANCTDNTLACGKQWNDTVATPWLTSDATKGVGRNQVVSPDFFEGGINLTKVFGSAGETAPSCFNTVVPDTRSSATITATLFDFVAEQLGECHSSTVTTPVDATDNTKPPASKIPTETTGDAKVTVQDKTVVTVTGVSPFAGSISWHICGPTATSSTQLCDGSTSSTTPACSTTVSCVGVDLGSQSITTSGTYYSPIATVTAAGRYCFRAEFTSTTNGVPGSSDSSVTECFTVGPVTPSISTAAVASPVNFGSAVQDNATLSGTAKEKGSGGPTGSDGTIGTPTNAVTLGGKAQGKITFTLYKSNCTDKATGTGTNPQTVDINGDGTYGPVSFTPDAPGTYYWDATYPGDSPNTSAATNNTSCPSDAEKVVVRQKPTSISTTQKVFPQDSALITDTIAGDNLPAGGVVTFYLYGATSGGNSAAVNCGLHGTTVGSGGLLAIFTDTQATAAHTFTATTKNQTSVAVSDNTTVYWRDTYDPGNSAFLGIQSDCVENTATTFVNDSGPGTAFP
jgi:hypothetical protein